jgi:hypothetical protein
VVASKVPSTSPKSPLRPEPPSVASAPLRSKPEGFCAQPARLPALLPALAPAGYPIGARHPARRSLEKGRELSERGDTDTVAEKDFEFEGLRGQLSDSDSWEDDDDTYSQLLSIRSLGSDGSSEYQRHSLA